MEKNRILKQSISIYAYTYIPLQKPFLISHPSLTILNILVALHLSRALCKSTLFMQNKPNFLNAQMNLTSFITREYKNKPRLPAQEKQTQSNPIRTQSNPTCSELAEPISKAKKMLLRLTIKGRRESFGYYADEIEAAKAYERAAVKYHGQFAQLNLNRKKTNHREIINYLYCFVLEEAFELARPYRVLQFPYGFRLNLSDALTGNLEDSAHFLQRIGVAVADSISQLDNLAFTI